MANPPHLKKKPTSTTPGNRKASAAKTRSDEASGRPGPPPTVDPFWVLKSVAIIVVLSIFCGYLTLCALYYHGQGQLVLVPSKTVAATPASLGLAFDQVTFDDTEAGQPQLTGWWIPAAAPPPTPHAALGTSHARSRLTLLYFHDGRGSLSDALPQLAALHTLGVNVFAIDYRGFGNSAPEHPSQRTMFADADAAWAYLTATRKVPPQTIALYGEKIGAAVAAQSAVRHPDAAAVVLVSPYASLLPHVLADPRSDLVPVRLLFHNRFNLAGYIAQVHQPKLVGSNAGFNGATPCAAQGNAPCPTAAEVALLYQRASDPKEFFDGSGKQAPPSTFAAFLSRFLDEYALTRISKTK